MSLEILSLTNLPEDLQHQIRNLDKDIKSNIEIEEYNFYYSKDETNRKLFV